MSALCLLSAASCAEDPSLDASASETTRTMQLVDVADVPAPDAEARSPRACTTRNHVTVSNDSLRALLGAPFDANSFSTALQPTRDGYALLVTSGLSSAERARVSVSLDGKLHAARLPAFPPGHSPGPLYFREVLGFVGSEVPGDQLVRILGVDTPTGESLGETISAQAIGPGDRVGVVEPLITYVGMQRLMALATTTSIDGSRTAVAVRNILGRGPLQVALAGADGKRVGAPLVRSTGSDRCLQIIPTEHAAALSYVEHTSDSAPDTWHLVELDAQANVVLESTHPVSGCPRRLTTGKDSFTALLPGENDSSTLARVDRHQQAPVPTVRNFGIRNEGLGLVPVQNGVLQVGRSGSSGELYIATFSFGGALSGLDAPHIPNGETTLLQSPHGDVTLAVATSDALEIFELGCPDILAGTTEAPTSP